MRLQKFLAVLCGIVMFDSSAQAAAPADVVAEVNSQLAADSTLLSAWITDQMRYVIPFNSTAGNVVPSQLKMFGIEFGVEGFVSGTKLDVNGLHALNTTLVDTQSIDTFSRLPFPLVLAHAKIGLPFGIDAGIRLGGIPKTTQEHEDSKGTIKNKVVGIDLRKHVIEEGAAKPFGLTVGLSYTHADGSIDITNTYDSLSTTINGHTASINNGMTTDRAEWKTNSLGLQAIVDKKILFVTPYLGASVNHHTGDIHNSITTTGTPVVDGIEDPTQPVSAVGLASAKAKKWDLRALLGFEFSILPFTKLGLHGEFAGSKNIAGGLGLRIQFR